MKNPYMHFPKFVLRTPIVPYNFYRKLTSEVNISKDKLKKAYADPLVKESCFLASPTLYFEIEKWINSDLDLKKERKISFSLLKYLTRMSIRCTPFGLFAGCSLGDIRNFTSIKNTKPKLNQRHTRLDMNYLVALSQDISKVSEIRGQLLYFPNSSIYVTGNQLRYIEYYYMESRRQHHVIEVDNSNYLQKIFKEAKSGAYLNDLILVLLEDGIPKEDAQNFIDELLESQLLVSELEPSVSGPEFMFQILKVLKKMKGVEREIQVLINAENQLNTIDLCIGNAPENYIALSNDLKNYSTSFDLKYLFQTDMELKPVKNNLSISISESIKKGMTLLNRLTVPIAKSNLSKFKDSFFERYEQREMPLSKVLDVETGIGYLQDRGSGDVNYLVDDIDLPDRADPFGKTEFTQNSIHRILEKKLIACDKVGTQKIVLTDIDFKDFPLNWDDLPDTLSAMIQVVSDDDKEKIVFSGMGGSSAANLLGRFCHGDRALNEFTQNIANLEKEINADKILAEIVHLPEARVGNILMRPSFREYEIPYLAKSSLDEDNQLPIQDLLISIRNDKIYLRSEKLNKEILPRLTNAHNFSANALPIYQFLCDMQIQNLRQGIYFNFGFLENNRSILPRVEYKNLILHKARWKINKDDITDLLSNSEDIKALKKKVEQWRKTIRLPKFALLTDGDNELLINFNNMTSVQMLLDTVKNRAEFVLTEFLFAEEGIVKSSDGHYSHQIVVSYFNEEKLEAQKAQENE